MWEDNREDGRKRSSEFSNTTSQLLMKNNKSNRLAQEDNRKSIYSPIDNDNDSDRYSKKDSSATFSPRYQYRVSELTDDDNLPARYKTKYSATSLTGGYDDADDDEDIIPTRDAYKDSIHENYVARYQAPSKSVMASHSASSNFIGRAKKDTVPPRQALEGSEKVKDKKSTVDNLYKSSSLLSLLTKHEIDDSQKWRKGRSLETSRSSNPFISNAAMVAPSELLAMLLDLLNEGRSVEGIIKVHNSD